MLFRIICPLFYVSFGGLLYYGLEMLYRGHSHYSMFLCGGIIFYCISLLNRKYESSLHTVTRMILSTFIILFFELFFGSIFNLHLHMDVWNYSTLPYNYKGQICLQFAILWFFLAFPILFLEKKIRYLFL